MTRLVFLLLAPAVAATPPPASLGRELFLRTWEPYDPRAQPGGDGLGPMYNATSCVGCHSLGGAGGGGSKLHNVRLMRSSGELEFVVEHLASTLVSRVSGPTAPRVERNTPALFGAGVIDTIPDAAILANVRSDGPITGRAAWTAEGRLARFGWKAHTASLADFVATACASELGLEVAGHPQALSPPGEQSDRLALVRRAERARSPEPRGVDLAPGEVEALTQFVSALPRPTVLYEQPARTRGEAVFGALGCGGCHVRDLGSASGLYSDLLLHDLGGKLADAASNYRVRGTERVTLPDILEDDDGVAQLAAPVEWRTPPLWGVRDSAPYLHDGRANTLDEAILAHDGEAEDAVIRYRALPLTERQGLSAFLESLVAPEM